MAAIVYGGSPRHHSRNTSSGHHLHQINTIQPSHQYLNISNSIGKTKTTSSQITIANQQVTNNILIPPTSYLTTNIQINEKQQFNIPQTIQQNHSQFQYQQQIPTNYHHSTIYTSQRHHNKRKSAVELLAESKPFYVKSEKVLDRHQHLNFRCVTGSNQSCTLSPSRVYQQTSNTTGICGSNNISNNRITNRRSSSSSSDLLQTKLRKLLNTDTTKDCNNITEITRYKLNNQKYDTFSKYQTSKYSQELSVHPSVDQVDDSIIFPSAFLSPQSLPPTSDDDIYLYRNDENLVLTDNYRAISPPAEYAAGVDRIFNKDTGNRCNYQYSYSHCQDISSDDLDYSSPTYNINSHKSLPDLHSQTSRHSPHSEVLSCCSRGNRSNKSGGGSSLNRDSGESSGHFTHRSEPCCRLRESNKIFMTSDIRRDSGSSTQHSGNSYYTSGIASRYDCPECRIKILKDSECLLNFTTSEVPEAFQDNHLQQINISKRYNDDIKLQNQKLYTNKQQTHNFNLKNQNSKEQDIISPPPLGTFKRQKCLRIKQRNRYSSPNNHYDNDDDDKKTILRSKSDISDRYWNRNNPLNDNTGKILCTIDKRGRSESLSQLEEFFDRLGLNDEKFNEIYIIKNLINNDNDSDKSSSPFLSDISTTDSIRLQDNNEINQTTEIYKPTEPPSIVERNARIIKWLCNCRKLQLL